MRSFASFAGQWVVTTPENRVVAHGSTPEAALRQGKQTTPNTRLAVSYISTHRPCVMLPFWPLNVIHQLAGDETWLAGGPVRDLLMGRAPSDWDFVVAKDAISLARTVANAMEGAFYALDTDRGTGRAIVKHPDTGERVSLDFASLRGSSLEDDLRLRDLTINAMALTFDGELTDPTGGQDDLVEGLIRLTHPGCLREDPIRLIRAVRFATELGFSLVPSARKQIREDSETIREVAPERIRDELLKLFCLPAARRGFRLLQELGLMPLLLPETARTNHAVALERTETRLQAVSSVLRTTVTGFPLHTQIPSQPATRTATLEALLREYNADLTSYLSRELNTGVTRSKLTNWCVLFQTTGSGRGSGKIQSELNTGRTASQKDANMADSRMRALRFSVRARTFVTTTLRETWRFAELQQSPLSRRDLYRYFRHTGETGVTIALLAASQGMLQDAALLQPVDRDACLRTVRAVVTAFFDQHNEVVEPTPLLTGRDLVELGFKPGPGLGAALEVLLEAQAAGEFSTASEARTRARLLALGK